LRKHATTFPVIILIVLFTNCVRVS